VLVLAYFGLQALVAFAFCVAIGRWWAIIPPVLFWPVYALGLEAGWCGDASGEDTHAILVATVVLGVIVPLLGGWAGVAVRERLRMNRLAN
jgi:hypothetical protein